jgi:hypothetical protein
VRGIRARLTATLLALVALTAAVLGVGSYLFVDYGLHQQALDDAKAQAVFDLSVLIPERLPTEPTVDDVVASRLGELFRQRGVETIVDLGEGDPYVSNLALDHAIDAFPADLRQRVTSGELAYAWTDVSATPALVIGGRLAPSGPDFYFVHDVATLETPASRGLGGALTRYRALAPADRPWRTLPVTAALAAERVEQAFSARARHRATNRAWAERPTGWRRRWARRSGSTRPPTEPALVADVRTSPTAGRPGGGGVDPARAPRRAAARQPPRR